MVIYGAGGYTKSIIDCLISRNLGVKGIFDDEPLNNSFNKYVSLGKYSLNIEPKEEIILAFEDNLQRKARAEQVSHIPGKLIHHSAVTALDAYIGTGTVIMHTACILPESKIGRHVIVNVGVSIDRDCMIYDFAHLAQQSIVCNNVIVGPGAYLGPSVTVLPNVKIGEWSIITAGSVIINDVPDYAIVAGNPGKIIKYRELKFSRGNTRVVTR